MSFSLKTTCMALVLLFAATSAANAHSKLGSAFKKNYRLRSVSCTACHLKESKDKKKDAMTPFGKKLVKLLDGKQVSERVEALKGKEKEESNKVWEEITKEFMGALKKLEEETAPSGKKYAEAIRAGEIEGTKARR